MDKKSAAIKWEAQEYVARDKNTGWYIGLVLVSLILIALSVWQGWWTFAILIVLSAVALIIYSVRPPRMINYKLDNKGLTEGDKLYPYDTFKSFGVVSENGHFSIVLTPRKRFSPRLTVFFPEQSGEAIVDTFGARMPMEEVKMDFLDKIVKFLRI